MLMINSSNQHGGREGGVEVSDVIDCQLDVVLCSPDLLISPTVHDATINPRQHQLLHLTPWLCCNISPTSV